MKPKITTRFLSFLLLLVVTMGCGGGGSNDDAATPNAPLGEAEVGESTDDGEENDADQSGDGEAAGMLAFVARVQGTSKGRLGHVRIDKNGSVVGQVSITQQASTDDIRGAVTDYVIDVLTDSTSAGLFDGFGSYGALGAGIEFGLLVVDIGDGELQGVDGNTGEEHTVTLDGVPVTVEGVGNKLGTCLDDTGRTWALLLHDNVDNTFTVATPDPSDPNNFITLEERTFTDFVRNISCVKDADESGVGWVLFSSAGRFFLF